LQNQSDLVRPQQRSRLFPGSSLDNLQRFGGAEKEQGLQLCDDKKMNYTDFKKMVNLSRQAICREVSAANRENIRVKNENTVIKNLEKIFDATLKISNKKGFQAMTLRDLSRETGLSMGALYSYFSSKEELLEMLQHQRRTITQRILEQYIETEKDVTAKLRVAIHVHLYLSEAMQPWFYFSYMEAKNLARKEREKAVASERYTEKILESIFKQGQKEGVFVRRDHRMSASVVKAMLQDWYLKRRKYNERHISVDHYAQFILEFIESFYQIRH
jgi:AcrR family transcriptional regulator